MAQKRVLVIGAILLAAGIGAPTTAFLAPGGVLSDPEAGVTTPPPVVEQAAPDTQRSASPTPRRTVAPGVPQGSVSTTPPIPVRSRAIPTISKTAHARDDDRFTGPPMISDQPPPNPPAINSHPDQPEIKPPPLPADDLDTADQ